MFPITKKIFKDLAREKTFLLTVFLQVLIIVSMSILLSYTTLFFNPEMALTHPARIAYNVDSPLIDYLSSEENVQLYHITDKEKALSMLEDNDIDVFLDENEGLVGIHLPNEKIKKMIFLSILKTPLDKYESYRYGNTKLIPIHNIKTQKTKGIDIIFETLYGFLIPFVFLLPIFMIGTLVIDLIAEDIETKRIDLLLTSTNIDNIVNQTILAGMILVLLQEILWISLISLRGISLSNIVQLLSYLALFSLSVFLLSLMIVIMTRKKAKAQLIYAVLVILLTAITNVSLLSPVNSIVAIIMGIISLPYWIYGFWMFVIASSYIMLKALTKKTV